MVKTVARRRSAAAPAVFDLRDPARRRRRANRHLAPQQAHRRRHGTALRGRARGTHLAASVRSDGRSSRSTPPAEAWMVAGGVGLAPFVTLAEALARRGGRRRGCSTARGARRSCTYVELFERLGVEVVLATEDGSRGTQGLRHRAARRRRSTFRAAHARDVRLYVCGPTPMMRAVAKLAAAHGTARATSRSSRSWAAASAAATAASCSTRDGRRHRRTSCDRASTARCSTRRASSGTRSRTDMDLSVSIGSLTLPIR